MLWFANLCVSVCYEESVAHVGGKGYALAVEAGARFRSVALGRHRMETVCMHVSVFCRLVLQCSGLAGHRPHGVDDVDPSGSLQ